MAPMNPVGVQVAAQALQAMQNHIVDRSCTVYAQYSCVTSFRTLCLLIRESFLLSHFGLPTLCPHRADTGCPCTIYAPPLNHLVYRRILTLHRIALRGVALYKAMFSIHFILTSCQTSREQILTDKARLF